MTAVADMVRVFVVVNWHTGRVHGMTCDVNQSAQWVRELCDKYPLDLLPATQAVALVDPAEQDIPIDRKDSGRR